MTEHAPLILDVAGTELTAADRRRLTHPLTGGVILFARNWENRAQLLQLTSSTEVVPESGALRATNAATAPGYVLGAELRACGVDFSFTPVLDLDWGESSVI